ncbi:hypothetical protein WA016_03729 [Myxococcus stipitatus]
MTKQFVYRFDAIVAITMGISLLSLAQPLTTLSGWSLPPALLLGVGLVLLPWAGFNAWVSPRSGRAPISV